MIFYEQQLLILSVLCVVGLFLERQRSNRKDAQKARDRADDSLENGRTGPNSGLAKLTRQYLLVYAVVMGADWLQGPYLYSLYRDQYQFEERLVAVLFVTGFVSAGLAAPVVGMWADQYGRRRACLAFCISYALACVCILIPVFPILIAGRILGGVSTSILFSAFESWLISSSTSMALPQNDLSTIMGWATLLNGFVATGAGAVSNELVAMTHSFASPFIASAILLGVAWIVMRASWGENYGSGGGASESDPLQVRRLGQAWNIVKNDPLLLAIGTMQTCFEGSMYLFVFIWVPSLQEVSPAYPSTALPLGFIFSSFMISMMLGSLLYNTLAGSNLSSNASRPQGDSSLVFHAKLSSCVAAVSALTFAVSVRSHDEKVRFWAFCAFEACVGMYYPVQGMLRGTLIANEHRATVSSLFRVPLNIFVVVSLLTGVSSARKAVLTVSSLLLALSCVMMGKVVLEAEKRTQAENIDARNGTAH